MPRKLTPSQEELLHRVGRAELDRRPLEVFEIAGGSDWRPSSSWDVTGTRRTLQQLRRRGGYLRVETIYQNPNPLIVGGSKRILLLDPMIRNEYLSKAALVLMQNEATQPESDAIAKGRDALGHARGLWSMLTERVLHANEIPDSYITDSEIYLKNIRAKLEQLNALVQAFEAAKAAFQASPEDVTAFMVTRRLESA